MMSPALWTALSQFEPDESWSCHLEHARVIREEEKSVGGESCSSIIFRSSADLILGVMPCRVEVKSEQMSLESFTEDGEWLCCPDIGREFLPPLRCQNRGESWLRSAALFAPLTPLKSSIIALNRMPAATGSQWRSWMRSSGYAGLVAEAGSPAKRELHLSRWEMTSAWTRSIDAKDQILRMLSRANLQDRAMAVMLRVQDSPLSRITPRFLAADEGNTVTSSTVTDRSMWGQSFPGMKRNSSLVRLSLRWWADVQAEMSADIQRWVSWRAGGRVVRAHAIKRSWPRFDSGWRSFAACHLPLLSHVSSLSTANKGVYATKNLKKRKKKEKRDEFHNVAVGGGCREREEQLGVVSVTLVRESMWCDCRASWSYV